MTPRSHCGGGEGENSTGWQVHQRPTWIYNCRTWGPFPGLPDADNVGNDASSWWLPLAPHMPEREKIHEASGFPKAISYRSSACKTGYKGTRQLLVREGCRGFNHPPSPPHPHPLVLLLISVPRKEIQLKNVVIVNWPIMWRTDKMMVGGGGDSISK